jgi:hypothetical protein
MKAGLILLIMPILLFLITWQNSGDWQAAGIIASWPAFLAWPVGGLFLSAGLLGRMMRRLDTRYDRDER